MTKKALQFDREKMLAEVREIFLTADKAHDFYHTERVMRIALQLQQRIDSNEELVFLIALLHDVDDKKIIQERGGVSLVIPMMIKFGYSEETQNRVVEAISEISFSSRKIPTSVEAKIVQDADRLDAIGAIGIARTFTYGGSKNVPIYDKENYCTITHFDEKLLKLAGLMNFDITKRIAQRRHNYMKEFLSQFFSEIACDSFDV